MENIEILGVRINSVDYSKALKLVESFIFDGKKHYIVTPNPEIVMLAQKDSELKQILNSADLAIPDGTGLKFVSLFLGREKIKERVTGVDLMEKICQISAHKGYKVGLLGGRGDTVFRTAESLSHKFPKLKLVVFEETANGLQTKDYGKNQQSSNRQQTREMDRRQKAVDILFVAFGAPKQEKWIAANLPKIPVKVAIGVGGAFEMITGKQRRAPKYLQKLGLEWFWRLILQPWRVKRQLALVVFVYFVIKQKLFHS